MRKRPQNQELVNKFIDGASTNIEEQVNILESTQKTSQEIDLNYAPPVENLTWPIDKEDIKPFYSEGCLLKKPLSINLNEKEWNTVDRHVKALGVSKDKWVKRAIFKQLYTEQQVSLDIKSEHK